MPTSIQPTAGKPVWPETMGRAEPVPPKGAVPGGSAGSAGLAGQAASRPNGADTGHGRTGGGIDRAQLEEALDALSRATTLINKGIQFKVHEGTDRLMVQVINRDNNEVIREIPPERILDLVASMQEFLGLLFDERV